MTFVKREDLEALLILAAMILTATMISLSWQVGLVTGVLLLAGIVTILYWNSRTWAMLLSLGLMALAVILPPATGNGPWMSIATIGLMAPLTILLLTLVTNFMDWRRDRNRTKEVGR